MCGLVGILSKQGNCDDAILRAMTRSLSHRGPDSFGHKISDFENSRVGFGHRRLSILDLSKQGGQPMESSNKRFLIIHNGEIYNFEKIQKELIQKGYKFNSKSDTEVVLNSFAEWGVECVHKFIGMFVFAILDRETRKLYIFRDRAGEKPLYYYQKNDLFCFSSELKALIKHPDFQKNISMDSLSLFFKYGYIPSPHSIFENTFKLKPGHYLSVDLDTLAVVETKYWDVLDYFNLPKIQISESEALKKIETLMRSACNYRMVSDVPVGVFLSGGYDSTAVAAILQEQSNSKLKTFTIGFEDPKYNEAPFAKQIASKLNTDHTEYYCTDKDLLDIIPSLPKIYDEPFADSSSIPTTLVSRIAKEQVSVALSADGGDEIFGGYTKYTRNIDTLLKIHKWRKFLKLPFAVIYPILERSRLSHKIQLIRECINAKDISMIARKRIESNYINSELQQKLLGHKFPSFSKTSFDEVSLLNRKYNNILDIMMGIDYKTYMTDDILHKVDRATMSVSLEGREPLLDHRLVEFVAKLPSNFKIKEGIKKNLLKNIVHKYVPKEMMDRPKKGFGIPFDRLFVQSKNEIFDYYLSNEGLKRYGIFDEKIVSKMKRDYHLNPNSLTQTRLWSIFIINQWMHEWI